MPIFALPIPSGLRPSPLDKGSRPPGPPFYVGPDQDTLAVNAKARVAQLIAFPSSFAAAHWAGDEGMALPWLKAPLGRWGSSCAVGGQRAGGGTHPYKETASGAFPSGYMVPPLQEVRNLPPHPSGLAASHLPLLGEGLGGAGFGPPPLARQTQAHKWNRTSGNFCKARAQWPGRNRGGHSLFSRRKFC